MNLITPNAFKQVSDRSKLSPTKEESGKLAPSVKASIVAMKTHAELKKISEQVTLGLIDTRRYLSQIEESEIGSEEWDAILSFMNVLSGVNRFLKRESTKLSNVIEDVRGEVENDS